jgi:hypothetical protein
MLIRAVFVTTTFAKVNTGGHERSVIRETLKKI